MTPSSSSPSMLARSWTTVAPGYANVFVPRFQPWTNNVLEALRDVLPPPPCKFGALIPCCGPGQELIPVAEILGPDAPVVGIDISEGMINVAKRRLASEKNAGRFNIQVAVADAMDPPLGPYRAIVSVFGLQQLPDPLLAIKSWVKTLEPGGVAVICFWPPGNVDDEGPWARWGDILKQKLGPSPERVPWNENLVDAARSAGAEILEDRMVSHEIKWENPTKFWEGMTKFGPWHMARLKRGDKFVDELGEELCSAYPPDVALVHSPRARILVLRRLE